MSTEVEDDLEDFSGYESDTQQETTPAQDFRVFRLTLLKPKFLIPLGFQYLKEIPALVCVACKATLLMKAMDGMTCINHYHHKHEHMPKLNPAAREKFNKKFEAFEKKHGLMLRSADAQNWIRRLPPLVERIETLELFEDGRVCGAHGCRAAWLEPEEVTMNRHRSDNHKGQPVEFKKGPVQRLGLEGRKYHFSVNPLLNNTTLDDPWLKWSQGFLADIDIGKKMLPQSVIDPDDRAAQDTFHSKTLWPLLAQRYSVTDTTGLVALPKPTTRNVLLKLTPVSKRWITSIPFGVMQNMDPIHRLKLNGWKRTPKEFTTVGKESHSNYTLGPRKLVMLILRVVRRSAVVSEPLATGANWDSVQKDNDDVLTVETPNNEDIVDTMNMVTNMFADEDGEGEADDDDFAGVDDSDSEDEEDEPNPKSDDKPKYPVFLTSHQSHAANELWDALQQDSTDAQLDERFQSLLFSLFTEIDSAPGRRLHTPMEAFFFAVHLRRDGSVKPAVLVTPTLSVMQYAILFCILKDALAHPDGIGSRLNQLSKWFDPAQISGFATTRYYQGIGWIAVKHLVGIPRVLFFKRGEPEFMFDGIKTSALAWTGFVHDLWRRANRILSDLLFGLTDDQLDLPRLWADVTDDQQNLADGYGFARTDQDTFLRLMKIFFAQPGFLDKYQLHKEADVTALLGFCRSVEQLKELFFMIIHVSSGGPKRITELLLHKLFNTLGRPRSVRKLLGRAFLIGDFSKTTANSGKDKTTIHLIPPALEPLFVRLCLIILPLERYFLLRAGITPEANANSYLFSSMGRRWGPTRGRKLIVKLTREYFQQRGFSAALIRHIIPAIIQHYELDIIQGHSYGANVAHQQGHTLSLAQRLYSNLVNLPNTITSAQILAILEFSEIFHTFLGLASPDGPTEVTANTLRAFTGRFDQESKLEALHAQITKLIEGMELLQQQFNAVLAQNQALDARLQQSSSTSETQLQRVLERVEVLSKSPPQSGSEKSANNVQLLDEWLSDQEENVSRPDRPTTPSPKPFGRKRPHPLDSPQKPVDPSSSRTQSKTGGSSLSTKQPAKKQKAADNGDQTAISQCPECPNGSGEPREIYRHMLEHPRSHAFVYPNHEQRWEVFIHRRLLDGHFLCPCDEDFAKQSEVEAHVAGFITGDPRHKFEAFEVDPSWRIKTDDWKQSID